MAKKISTSPTPSPFDDPLDDLLDARPRGGRPRKQIDPDLVESLAGIGCTQEEIGRLVGCSVDTLARRYADVLKDGASRMRASLRRRLFRLADTGSAAAAIFLAKNLLGMRDAPAEVTSEEEVANFRRAFRAQMRAESGLPPA